MRLPLRAWKTTLESLGFSVERQPVKTRSRRVERYSRRCLLETLESRQLLTTNWLVTTLSDATSHTGTSLRDAIVGAAASTGGDVITFDSSLFSSGPQQINLSSSLNLGSYSTPELGDITINGPTTGKLTINGSSISSGSSTFSFSYNNAPAYTVTFNDVTLSSAPGAAILRNGGSFVSLALNNVNITGNGSGISSNASSGTLMISNSTISGNAGTGVSVGSGDTSLDINNSTIANNNGVGVSTLFTTATITNSTISGNRSTGSVAGLSLSSTATLTNDTVSGNQADINNTSGSSPGIGGVYAAGYGVVTLQNTIVAANYAGADNHTVEADIGQNNAQYVGGSFSSTSSYNLIGYDSVMGNNLDNGVLHNQVGETVPTIINPRLAPLGNYGGSTQTMALLDGSPAIDTGPTSSSLSADQRGSGFARKVGNNVDIGAYEWNKPTLQVDNNGDTNDGNYGPGQLTLREAIALAGKTPGADAITFASGLTSPINLSSALTLGDPVNPFLGDVTIVGPGIDYTSGNYFLTITGNGTVDSVFKFSYNQNHPFQFAISGLKLTGTTGTVINEIGPFLNKLSIDNVEISGNQGPAIYDFHSPMSLTNSTISNNQTGSSPAITIAYGATATLTGDRINNNVSSGQVGALLVTYYSTATLTSVMVEGNRADANNSAAGSTAIGGMYADNNGDINLQSSIVIGNWAGTDGPNQTPSDLGAGTATGGHFDSSSANNLTGDDNSGTLPGGNNNAVPPPPPPPPLPNPGTPELVPLGTVVSAGVGNLTVTGSGLPTPYVGASDPNEAFAAQTLSGGGGTASGNALGATTNITQAGFGISGVENISASAQPTSQGEVGIGRPGDGAILQGLSEYGVSANNGATGQFSWDLYFVFNWQAVVTGDGTGHVIGSSVIQDIPNFTFLLPGNTVEVFVDPADYPSGDIVVISNNQISIYPGADLHSSASFNIQGTGNIGDSALAYYRIGCGC